MQYDLVFEGGGARGVIFVGAMAEFEAREHTVGRLLGTSAGAIMAVLTAAGYSAAEMHKALTGKSEGASVFATFLGVPPPFTRDEIRTSATRAFLRDLDFPLTPKFVEDPIDDMMATALLRFPVHRNLVSLVERGGWYGAEAFVAWLYEKLSSGHFQGKPRRFGDATLAEFHAATGKAVSVVAADTTSGRMRVLNHRTAPRCPLVWAVRMSMSMPFIYPEVVWMPEWGDYLGRSLSGHALVDGGVLSGFPIELLLSDEPYVTELMGPRSEDAVLGLLIDETLAVPGDPIRPIVPGGVSLTQLRMVQRLARLISTMTTARDRLVVDAFERLVARLPARGYGTIEFDMGEKRRELLVQSGRIAMRAYFDQPPASDLAPPSAEAQRLAMEYVNRVALRMLEP